MPAIYFNNRGRVGYGGNIIKMLLKITPEKMLL
jgi:hypothetical protein